LLVPLERQGQGELGRIGDDIGFGVAQILREAVAQGARRLAGEDGRDATGLVAGFR
jgi:hypothetical protein